MLVCSSMVECCRPQADNNIVDSNNIIITEGNRCMNSRRAIAVALRATEGGLCRTDYDAYDFMVDIGSVTAAKYYLDAAALVTVTPLTAVGTLLSVLGKSRRKLPTPTAQHPHRRGLGQISQDAMAKVKQILCGN